MFVVNIKFPQVTYHVIVPLTEELYFLTFTIPESQFVVNPFHPVYSKKQKEQLILTKRFLPEKNCQTAT